MSQESVATIRPWEMPVWKPARGNEGTLVYLVVIHALAIAGVILFPLPSMKVFLWTLVLAGLGGLGTTVCYHRTLAHRTVKLNPVVEFFLIAGAIFNGSGAPASWVAYHRHHHANSDTPDDISSPQHGGFWWAHLRWLYQSPQPNVKKWCPELDRGTYRIWHYLQGPVLLLSIFCGLVFGFQGFFWMGAIRLVYSLHMQCLVNSLTHIGSHDAGDSSRNVWWLGPLQLMAWGENWHRNHHNFAGSARFGLRWWQTDIGWYFIYMLETIGLANNVKRPRAL
jgi:fatty-acid desaturase